MRKRLAVLPFIWLLLFVLYLSPESQPEAAQFRSAPPPQMILLLVIDQFRPDYLVRFRTHFGERGFNLLLDGGAVFLDCRYDCATTVTGPGHTTLLTGAYPSVHGIVGNEWFDRAQRRVVHSVRDPGAVLLGAKGRPGFSPRHLLGTTLGDELRMASGFDSKVLAISLKDYAAVLAGGHAANAAYAYDSATGHFVSSTYYMPSLPAWVQQFNSRPPAKDYCGKAWKALEETPGGNGKILRNFSRASDEPCPNPKFLQRLSDTPFVTEIELAFAREAVKNERLGQDSATDLLIISLSANDHIGHEFGPYSVEVADTTIRTDRYLAEFFSDIDRLVGLENVWIALSADHGVAPTPQFIEEHRLGIGLPQVGAVRTTVERALSQAYGSNPWVESSNGAAIYLNPQTLKKHGVDRAKAEAIAAEAAVSVPGVHAAYTRTQLLTGRLPASPLSSKAANSFHSQRSGDLFVILEPYAVPSDGKTSTTHGSPWNYDAQVPLILWGSAFKPGAYAAPCQTIDLAPTLAAALGLLQPSGAHGKVLASALK